MELVLSKYTISLSDNALNILNQYRQVGRNSFESGGIILGQVENGKVYVTKLSIPNQLDKANKTYFERHQLPAQLIINHEFHNSDGKTIYLGEWHTHPELHPTPSHMDIKMLQKQFEMNTINIDCIFLIIQGISHVYIGEYNGKSFVSKTLEI